MANTLWNYYASKGQSLPSVPERRKQFNLGPGYSGSASQNTALLSKLQGSQGSPVSSATPTINTSSSNSTAMNSNWNNFVEAASSVASRTGFPLGVLLGQAALETGRNPAHAPGNNWFGIKGEGTAGNATSYTWEFLNGKWQRIKDAFASFNAPEEGIMAYIDLIQRKYPNAWAKRDDPVAMINEIKKGGYATDPNYVKKVMSTPEFKTYKQSSVVSGQQFMRASVPTKTVRPALQNEPTYDDYGRIVGFGQNKLYRPADNTDKALSQWDAAQMNLKEPLSVKVNTSKIPTPENSADIPPGATDISPEEQRFQDRLREYYSRKRRPTTKIT